MEYHAMAYQEAAAECFPEKNSNLENFGLLPEKKSAVKSLIKQSYY